MVRRFPAALGLLPFFLLFPAESQAGIPQSERDALVALYNATGGDNWTDNTNWLGAEGTECTWFGVTCHDDENNLRHLSLRNNNLIGTIPPELGDLARPQTIELSINQLTGEIPPELGMLTGLGRLLLHSNQLTGEIPSELGNLANVNDLFLDRNQLTRIPPELGNMARLRRLSLSENRLTGKIPPELGNMADLRSLGLALNQLSGEIPAELGSLADLGFLSLADNRLQGAVPDELSQLTDLDEGGLDLRFNHLYTDNNALRDFLNSKQFGGDWERFQTLHLYFAQFGDGLGLFSQVVLFSLNQIAEATGQIDILGAAGQGLSVDLNGEIIEGTRDFNVPASGLLSLRTDGQGDLIAGSARITSDRHLEGVVIFGGDNGLAGVGSSPDFPFGFAAPMQSSEASQINSGIAVTRLSEDQDPLGEGQGSLQMTLLDTGGAVLATASDQLPPNGHKALFVTEINWDTPVDFSDFIGILRVTCSEPVTATVVQTRADELVTMPVAGLQPPQPQPAGHYGGAPAGAAQHHYYFAQFADGLGLLSSQILLLNLSQVAMATADLTLKGNDGSLLTVDLNGQEVAGQTQVQIAPNGLQVLATDGQGELSAGSVSVSSNQPLAGVIVFAGTRLGAAGVGSSAELAGGFLAPMETDEDLVINTGVAVMNLEMAEVTLDAELISVDGSVIATAQLKLAGMGHDAIFIDEFEWSVPVDFSRFEGLLRVSSSGRIAAAVIQTRPGQFATMPVAAL